MHRMLFAPWAWTRAHGYLLFFALVLLPFFPLALFSQPASDDFVYAARAQELGFVGSQRDWYQNWCGRYFATAIQSGFPLACDMIAAYPLVSLVTLGTLAFGMAALSRTLHQRLHGPLNRLELLGATLAFAAIYVTQMPSLCEGFYWLAGAVTYEFALAMGLLLIACLLSIREETSKWMVLVASLAAAVLAFAMAGCNETLLPLMNLVLLGGCVVSILKKHPSRAVWAAALAAYFLGSWITILSPGNFHRAALFTSRPPLALCLANGIWGIVRYALKWAIRPMLLGATVLAIPLIAQTLKRTTWAGKVAGRHVLLSAAVSLGAVALTFLPSYAGMGLGPPARALNVGFFLFLAGWFATLVLAVAWFHNRTRREPQLTARTLTLGRVALVAGVLLIGHFPRGMYDLAWRAPIYRQAVGEHYALLREVLQNPDRAEALKRLPPRPASVVYSDISEVPLDDPCLVQFFGVASALPDSDSKMMR